MPISEQQFSQYVEFYNDPEVTPEQKDVFGKAINQYREQQDEVGLSLTPNLDRQIDEENKRKDSEITGLFSGLDKVPNFIPSEYQSLYEDNEGKAMFANKTYLKSIYSENYNDDDYETFKADYSKKNNFSPKTEADFYNFLTSKVGEQKKTKQIKEESFQLGFDSINSNEPLSDAVARFQKERKDNFDIESFTKSYQALSSIIAPHREDMLEFRESLFNKMDGNGTEADDKVIKDFGVKLKNMKPSERQVVLAKLFKDAEKEGAEKSQSKNVVQEFGESFGRIYSDMVFGGSTRLVEKAIRDIPEKGSVITSIPEIKSLEDAEKYVGEMTTAGMAYQAQLERPGLGDPALPLATFIPNGKERALSDDETYFIERAKRRAQTSVNVERDIQAVSRSIDPIRDNWKGIMASGAGSTAGILLPAAFAGGGAVLAKGYADMEYNDLRREYPTMSITDAENISIVSGAIQSSFDKLNLSFLKRLPNVSKLITGESSMAKALLKRAGTNFLEVGIFENSIEGFQDATTPAVQYFFAKVEEDIPQIALDAEWLKWKDTRADVAIGMLPLMMLGTGFAAASDYKNGKQILSNNQMMEDLGILEKDRKIILDLVANDKLDEATVQLKDAFTRRDPDAVNTRIANFNQNVQDSTTDTQDSVLEQAKRFGITPDIYREGSEYVVNDRKGTDTSVSRFGSYNQAAEQFIRVVNDNISGTSESLNKLLSQTDLKEGSLLNNGAVDVFDNDITTRNDIVSQLNGLSKDEISKLNEIFGNEVDNTALIGLFAESIFRKQSNVQDMVKTMADQIINNSDPTLSDFIKSEAAKIGISARKFVIDALKKNKPTDNLSFNHVINRGKADMGRVISTVKKVAQKNVDTIMSTQGVELSNSDIIEEINNILPVTNQTALSDASKKRKQELDNIRKKPSVLWTIPGSGRVIEITSEGWINERKTESEKRAIYHRFGGRINKALRKTRPTLSTLADINAVLEQDVTVDEWNTLTAEQKITKTQEAVNKLDDLLKESYRNEFKRFGWQITPALAALKERDKAAVDGSDSKQKIQNAIRFLKILQGAIGAKSSTASNRASKLYSKLYPQNGVPNIGDGSTFYWDLLEYNAYRSLSNLDNLSTAQLRQANKFLIDTYQEMLNPDGSMSLVESEFFNTISSDVANARSEVQQNSSVLDKKAEKQQKLYQNKGKMDKLIKFVTLSEFRQFVSSFYNNHLTFASLLELVSPNQKAKAIRTRIEELLAKQSDQSITADETDELNKLRSSFGKNISPTFQRISDNINNGFLQVNEETADLQDAIIADVRDIFGKKGKLFDMDAKTLLAELRDTAKGLAIKVNGHKHQISTAYAAYILNIADQKVYNNGLADKGFTVDVIQEIRQKMETDFAEVEAFRKQMLKRIGKEVAKTNEEYKRLFGYGIPIPTENFFPVQFKNRQLADIDPYDIQYQSGNMNIAVDQNEQVGGELDLDITTQVDNLLTMYNSYMNQSIYRRALMGPIIAAKNVLTDSEISDTIEESFGKDFKQLIFKQLNAFETNGIRSDWLDAITTRRIRKMFSNVARGAMGFRLSTIFVNTLSMGNTLMDASIPLPQAIKSYSKVFLSLLDGSNSSKMTAAQALLTKDMKERIRTGANALVAMSKAQTMVDAPGWFNEAAAKSLSPMSYMDAFAGSVAAAAAYDAHYTMAEKAGITDKSQLDQIAKEGMARTINKTFQPAILSGKSTFEMQSNPLLKMITMFMSEARKTLGLEITTIKKDGIFSKEFGRMFLVNHIIIGTLAFVMRASIRDLLSPEDKDDQIWDMSRMSVDILLGPLSATLIAGTIFEDIGYGIHNKLIDIWNSQSGDDQKKTQIFADSNPIAQAGKQAMSIASLGKGVAGGLGWIDSDEEYTEENFMKDLNNGAKGIASLTGNGVVGGLATMSNIAKQVYDLINSGDEE